MRDAGGGGAVVNIASISSFIAQPGFVPYSTSKGECEVARSGSPGVWPTEQHVCDLTLHTANAILHCSAVRHAAAIWMAKLLSGISQSPWRAHLPYVPSFSSRCALR